MTDDSNLLTVEEEAERLAVKLTLAIETLAETQRKIFAQTQWLCAMVSAIQATLPPPMQQAVTAAFQQVQAQGSNHD